MTQLTYEVRAISQSQCWALRVKTPAGIGLEYRYSTERQARFMAAVLALGPAKLPPAHRVIATSMGRKRQRSARCSAELAGVTSEEIDGALGMLGESEDPESELSWAQL